MVVFLNFGSSGDNGGRDGRGVGRFVTVAQVSLENFSTTLAFFQQRSSLGRAFSVTTNANQGAHWFGSSVLGATLTSGAGENTKPLPIL